jgi:excisionase family DNA binding protein
MSAEEVAVELKRSVSTVYNWRNAGLLRQEQVGSKKKFVRSEVMDFKAQLIAAGELELEVQAS